MVASLVFVPRNGPAWCSWCSCWPAWCSSWTSCSCQDMLAMLASRVFVPRYAGQPGVRAKTCWPARCSCQDMDQPGVRAKTVGPSSVPAFCDSSVPAGLHSSLPAWWAQMSQIDGSPLCSKLHKCSTHKYCVGADDLRCFGALQLLENVLRNCHRCLL